MKRINIALICTIGGHFEQMVNLSKFYSKYNHFWITNRGEQTLSELRKENFYFVKGAHFTKPWTYLNQIIPLIKIFRKERPSHILSTGSGRIAFIPFVLSKVLNIDFLYIDTFSRVLGYSKFGSFLLKIRHHFFSQWTDAHNKSVEYIGPIFEKLGKFNKISNSKYIFVTVGTRPESFHRLVEAVEDLVNKNTIKDKVIVQAGHTKYNSRLLHIFDFCAPQKIDELILNARYVITQESAGIGTKCLRYKTKFFVMPREYKYAELPVKSDMKEDLHYQLENLGYTVVVRNKLELEVAINRIAELKTGFKFDNNLAISKLTKYVEAT